MNENIQRFDKYPDWRLRSDSQSANGNGVPRTDMCLHCAPGNAASSKDRRKAKWEKVTGRIIEVVCTIGVIAGIVILIL